MLQIAQLKSGIKYTGVGARLTPSHVCNQMTEFAECAHSRGWILRSGGQPLGTDWAFEKGAGDRKEIYTKRSKLTKEMYAIAKAHHPIFDYLPAWHQDLLARNVPVVLGEKLDDPSSFLVGWTQDGMHTKEQRTKKSGGTGHTISIALAYGVPVFNLNVQEHLDYVTHTLMRE